MKLSLLLLSLIWFGGAVARALPPEKIPYEFKGRLAPEVVYQVREIDGKLEPHRLSELRHQWVFVLFGSAAQRETEAMSLALARIGHDLAGEPFTVLVLYRDPTADDTWLSAGFDLNRAGFLYGWLDPTATPLAYRFPASPVSLLLGPDGVAVWSWHGMIAEGELRRTLQEQLTGRLALPKHFAAVPHEPRDQVEEQFNVGDSWHALGRQAARTALVDPKAALEFYEELARHYPESLRVKTAQIALTKRPEEWSVDDLGLLTQAMAQGADASEPFARAAGGYAAEDQLRLSEAERFFASLQGDLRIHAIGFWARHDLSDKAIAALRTWEAEQNIPAPTQKSPSRVTTWRVLRAHLAARDWEGARPWARHLAEVTVHEILVPGTELLIAERLGDRVGARQAWELWNSWPLFPAEEPAYGLAQEMAAGNVFPTWERMEALGRDPHRLGAIIWAAANLEGSRPEAARAAWACAWKSVPAYAEDAAWVRSAPARENDAVSATSTPAW